MVNHIRIHQHAVISDCADHKCHMKRRHKRFALPNAEIMIHQPSAGTQGKVTDMEIDVEHFLRIKKNLNEILASNTGKTAEEVKAASERDHWMTADEAKDFGLVDKIITAKK